jgi:hypothetical protein
MGQEGGSAGVYDNTLRKPTTMPTKLAAEIGLVWKDVNLGLLSA